MGGAQSGALSGDSGSMGEQGAPQLDRRLAALIEAWDTLPEGIRAGIAAMVESTLNTDGGQA
ncbi:MAG: hypothetical protein ACYTF7_09430 [Planctomycetota bacterium]